LMFAPNVIGTANATAAGWGNLGGGVTQIFMISVHRAVLLRCAHFRVTSWMCFRLGVETALWARLTVIRTLSEGVPLTIFYHS